jgi:hypothetical protein
MKSADLHKLWNAPDNSRLTAKQQSFRLPVHVAAKLNALCDLFPTKTKTQIVGDLLSSAIDDLVNHLPVLAGEPQGPLGNDGQEYFTEAGPRAEFRRLANKHNRELERDLGNKDPADLFTGNYVVQSDEIEGPR